MPTLPSFWLGLLLMLVFSVWLGWLPVSGARGASSLVLPVLTIGLGGTALVARITRVAMVETQRKDFVMLLHAKGMHPMRIQLLRVLHHALIPVVTILACLILKSALGLRESHCPPRHLWRAVAAVGSQQAWS
jgi:ABC-type dipeptide/oligopeptide/nickel transport system permease component